MADKKALIVVEKNKARIVNDLPPNIHRVLTRNLGYLKKVMVREKDHSGFYRNVLKNKLHTKFNYITGEFPVGLIDRCKKTLKQYGYKVKILYKYERYIVPDEQVIDQLKTFGTTLRPYQIDAVATGILNPMMTFHISTGGGKTLIFEALTHIINLKTLVLVNRGDLLFQHVKEFKKQFGDDIGIIKGNQLNYDKKINIATIQTLVSQLKRNRYQTEKFLNTISYIISDENHLAKSNTWKRIIHLCKNASYKHGFSGTPWDHGSQNIELEAVCGSIKVKITASDLIRLGYLAKPTIIFHRYPGNGDMIEGNNLHSVYENGIVNNTSRNKAIVKVVAEEYFDRNSKLLLVVNRIKHGHILSQLLRKMGIHDREIGYLHGSKSGIVRQHGKKEFERGEIRIMIVSQIWNEGIDIPSCDVLVKADSFGGGEIYESEGVRNLLQQIGRILRKPIPEGFDDVDTETPHHVRVHDFTDRQHRFLENWTRNRFRTCKIEKEWIVKTE
jgi:superfamily II DNA or RNA helicase